MGGGIKLALAICKAKVITPVPALCALQNSVLWMERSKFLGKKWEPHSGKK